MLGSAHTDEGEQAELGTGTKTSPHRVSGRAPEPRGERNPTASEPVLLENTKLMAGHENWPRSSPRPDLADRSHLRNSAG